MARPAYRSLDHSRSEFRLLEILPFQAGPDAILKFRLSHARLHREDTPKYETISYCWGDPTPCRVVDVDHVRSMIPANAHSVLLAVALEYRSRIVWIDAICINQADQSEREEQVLSMRDIYSSSVGNIAHFGEIDDVLATRIADNIEEIMLEIKEDVGQSGTLKHLIQPNGRWFRVETGIRTDVDFVALAALFGQAWFRRVWVRQEVLLAPANTCILGRVPLRFEAVFQVAAWLYIYHAHHVPRSLYRKSGLKHAAMLWDIWSLSTHSSRAIFFRSLLYAKDLEATDQRDKVYSILPYTNTSHESRMLPLISPNYSAPVVDVFRDATRYSLLEQGNTDVLTHVSHRDQEDLRNNKPSWVPRFDRAMDSDHDPATLPSGYRGLIYQPQSIEESDFYRFDQELPEQRNAHELWLRGRIIASIGLTYPIFEEEDTTSFTEMFFQCVQGPDSVRYTTRFSRTLSAGRDPLRRPWSADELRSHFDEWLAYFLSSPRRYHASLTSLAPHEQEGLHQAARMHHAIRNAVRHRRFIMTDEGFMALVPKLSRSGDIIAVMEAADTPYVLRPIAGPDGGAYLLLGECYIEDHMGDEAYERIPPANEALFVIQ